MSTLPKYVSYRLPAFLLLATLITGLEVVVTQTTAFHQHPITLSFAVLFDLVFLVTGLFYWIIIRPLSVQNGRLVIVAMLMVRVAFFVLPENSLLPNKFWPFLFAFAEGVVLVVAVLRMRSLVQTYRRLRLETDTQIALQDSLCAVFGQRTAGFIFGEALTIYYVLFGWRLRSDVPTGAKTLTTHRQSGQVALTAGVLVVGLIEGTAVHLLLTRWNPTVAFWIMTLSAYGLLFLVADAIATVKRPSYLTSTYLYVRLGLRWHATIPRSLITDVLLISEKPEKRANQINGAFLTGPNMLLTLREPILFQGPYGIKKETTMFSFFVDDKAEIIELLIGNTL